MKTNCSIGVRCGHVDIGHEICLVRVWIDSTDREINVAGELRDVTCKAVRVSRGDKKSEAIVVGVVRSLFPCPKLRRQRTWRMGLGIMEILGRSNDEWNVDCMIRGNYI